MGDGGAASGKWCRKRTVPVEWKAAGTRRVRYGSVGGAGKVGGERDGAERERPELGWAGN
ncbi:hypothetical protein GCM10020219_080400 [Nonomuraea dietziae]